MKKGSISYKNQHHYEYRFPEFGVRVEKLTLDVARLWFVDLAGQTREPPAQTLLHDVVNDVRHPAWQQSFFLNWIGSQTLEIGGVPLLAFGNQRLQSVNGACINWLVRNVRGEVVRFDGERVNRAQRLDNNNWLPIPQGAPAEVQGPVNDDVEDETDENDEE